MSFTPITNLKATQNQFNQHIEKLIAQTKLEIIAALQNGASQVNSNVLTSSEDLDSIELQQIKLEAVKVIRAVDSLLEVRRKLIK